MLNISQIRHRLTVFCLMAALSSNLSYASSPDAHLYLPSQHKSIVDHTVNISAFVYRDNNVNGVYDLGDLPMSGIYVGLNHNQKRIFFSKTNNAGFANFKTSAVKKNAVIKKAGLYEFVMLMPNKWRVTSGNEKQTVAIQADDKKITGLTLVDYLKPVGLTPIKVIQGRYDFDKQGVLSLLKGNELVTELSMTPNQTFEFEVDQGEYTLTSQGTSRIVGVTNTSVYVGGLQSGQSTSTDQKRITFDDLVDYPLFKIPNGYAGIDWQDINIIRRDHGKGNNLGYINGVMSGEYLAYTTQYRPGEVFSKQPFDFHGVYLTTAWQEAEGVEVKVEIWRDEQKVAEDVFNLSALGPIHYQPNISDVTRIRFTSMNGMQVVFDDMTIARCDTLFCKIKRKFDL